MEDPTRLQYMCTRLDQLHQIITTVIRQWASQNRDDI